MSTRDVLLEVLEERHRQDQKWGEQNHAPGPWMLILAEEVGEVARAALANIFAEANDAQSVRRELIEVAAVAVAWAQSIDRSG